MAKRPPTDFELLRAIHEHHRDDFASSDATKVLVPIDIPEIADELDVDVNSVFGRLYYHLEPLYADGAKKFFAPRAGSDSNCINFPLLEAVLAGLWQQRNRDLSSLVISITSLLIAIGSLTLSIVTAT